MQKVTRKNYKIPYAKAYGRKIYAGYDVEVAEKFTVYTAIVFSQLYRMLEYALKKAHGMEALDNEGLWDSDFYMPMSTIVRQTRIPQSTVSNCIDRLESGGFLKVRRLPDRHIYRIQWAVVRKTLKQERLSDSPLLAEGNT
jgi:DNA-binding MarR family transcriptional regulator